MISLVTGANRGIGREVCRQLAALGHTVLLTARSDKAAAGAAAETRAHPIRLDVTSESDIARVNAICPGWVATDMGGPGGRPVTEGAAGIVWAATLPDNGPTFRDGRPLPW